MSRQQILDFQARWMRPAGIAGILGAALLVAAAALGSVGSADDTAEQLELYQDHAGQLTLASGISALGLILLSTCLFFVFRSALARADRMRAFVGPVILTGAVMIAAQGVLIAVGLKDASDGYAAGVAAVETRARQEATQARQPETTTTPTTRAPNVEQRISDARDDFAEDEINDTSAVRTGQVVGLVGGLALIGGAVYTLIWALRTGLLTRFMATLGIVLIAALVLIPTLGPIAIFWFAVLGLMLAGWWIRPLPPAWAAAEAIPWPAPGEENEQPPDEGRPGTVEGRGREISEAPPAAEEAGAEQALETPGQRRKKRKRRK